MATSLLLVCVAALRSANRLALRVLSGLRRATPAWARDEGRNRTPPYNGGAGCGGGAERHNRRIRFAGFLLPSSRYRRVAKANFWVSSLLAGCLQRSFSADSKYRSRAQQEQQRALAHAIKHLSPSSCLLLCLLFSFCCRSFCKTARRLWEDRCAAAFLHAFRAALPSSARATRLFTGTGAVCRALLWQTLPWRIGWGGNTDMAQRFAPRTVLTRGAWFRRVLPGWRRVYGGKFAFGFFSFFAMLRSKLTPACRATLAQAAATMPRVPPHARALCGISTVTLSPSRNKNNTAY